MTVTQHLPLNFSEDLTDFITAEDKAVTGGEQVVALQMKSFFYKPWTLGTFMVIT